MWSCTRRSKEKTSSRCYVNAVQADDEEKYLVSELNQQLKESMERYIALECNVLVLLHIMLPDLNIVKISSIDDFVIQLII